MPRPVKYQREQLLDAALALFWQEGYHATSVEALGKQMDLHPGSLYHAFADKHTLFLAVLDRYVMAAGQFPIQFLAAATDQRAGISDLFEVIIQVSLSPAGRRGCLMTNTAMELGLTDEAIAQRIVAYHQAMEDAFFAAIDGAMQAGNVTPRSSSEARALARFLTSSLQGVRVMLRTATDVAALRDVTRLIMQVLD